MDKQIESFEEFEHAGWQFAAEEYERSLGALTSQAIPFLLDELGFEPNEKFLDLATGPGYVAAAAAERGAEVTGVDFSEQMVERAQARYPRIAFQLGNVEDLQLSPGSFDAAAMNFGILHLGDPGRAIQQTAKVLRIGGRFAFTSWLPPDRTRGFEVVLEAVRLFGDPELKIPTGPDFFAFSSPDRCRAVLTAGGFCEPRFRELPLEWSVPSGEALFHIFLNGTARTGALLRRQSSDARDRIRNHIVREVERFRSDSHLVIPMPAMLVVSKKG